MTTGCESGRTIQSDTEGKMEMLSQAEIQAIMAHESATAERVAMVAKVQRKRAQRERTLTRRRERFAKYSMQNRGL